jgi:hypothetical protein
VRRKRSWQKRLRPPRKVGMLVRNVLAQLVAQTVKSCSSPDLVKRASFGCVKIKNANTWSGLVKFKEQFHAEGA